MIYRIGNDLVVIVVIFPPPGICIVAAPIGIGPVIVGIVAIVVTIWIRAVVGMTAHAVAIGLNVSVCFRSAFALIAVSGSHRGMLDNSVTPGRGDRRRD